MTDNTPPDPRLDGPTPGPWVATERSGYHEILAPDDTCDWYGRPNMHAVAYCDTEIDEAEQTANARLIAAAPDLLEALVEILGPLNICSDNPHVRDDAMLPIDMTMGELRKARAAITRARGKDHA